MDSKLVSKELRKQMKPILKERGFTTFTTRVFWRHKEDRIEVIDFKSTGNIKFSLPAASFTVNIGIYFLEYPLNWEAKEKNGLLLPTEWECSFRLSLKKGINQKSTEFSNDNYTWIITDDTSLQDCIDDCLCSLDKDGFPFFEKFQSEKEVIRFLIEEQAERDYSGDYSMIHGMGQLGCRARNKQTAYFALLFGKPSIARKYLSKLIEQGDKFYLDRHKKEYKKLMKNL